jgi:hypothetical protein
VSGWIKRGPYGIIDSTLRDAVETYKIIQHHVSSNMLVRRNGRGGLLNHLEGISRNFVDYEDWVKIDEYETKRAIKKPREKLL